MALHWLILILLVLLTFGYVASSRWWFTEAVSVWPSWFSLMGLAPLTLLADRRSARRWTWMMLAALALWAFIFSEGYLLLRVPFARNTPSGETLRIVSLNMGGTFSLDARVIRELRRLRGDIYCLQELPDAAQGTTGTLLVRSFPNHEIIVNGDCAIMSRFPMQEQKPGFVAWGEQKAGIGVPGKGPVTVFNVRMPLPGLRLNFFSREARDSMRGSHRERKESFAALARVVNDAAMEGSVILAGDFNTPARSTLFSGILKGLQDIFHSKGRGWGNTITHDFPVSRIDLIFASRNFEAIDCRSERNGVSDHRTVWALLRSLD